MALGLGVSGGSGYPLTTGYKEYKINFTTQATTFEQSIRGITIAHGLGRAPAYVFGRLSVSSSWTISSGQPSRFSLDRTSSGQAPFITSVFIGNGSANAYNFASTASVGADGTNIYIDVDQTNFTLRGATNSTFTDVIVSQYVGNDTGRSVTITISFDFVAFG